MPEWLEPALVAGYIHSELLWAVFAEIRQLASVDSFETGVEGWAVQATPSHGFKVSFARETGGEP